MRSVVIGDIGPIGPKLVTNMGAPGSEAAAAPPNSGVNTLAGEAPADARERGSVVVDVSHSPCLDHAAVLQFFETSIAYFGEVEHSFRLMPNARIDTAESTLGTASPVHQRHRGRNAGSDCFLNGRSE
jgi:hypothetical protein